MTGELDTAARQLALDAAAIEVLDAFAVEGIRAILLKGAAIATRLYEDLAERSYGDVDLLVETTAVPGARRALERLGFAEELAGARADEGSAHATTWRRTDPRVAHVDLHTSLAWRPDDPAGVWRELSCDTARLQLGPRSVEILSQPAQAFVVATHLAQHGPVPKLLDDVGRALARFDRETWRQAAAIAARLRCTEMFAAGLRLDPDGRVLLAELGLDEVTSTPRVRLMAAGASPGSVALMRLAEASTPRERLGLLARMAFPSRAYMRRWSRVEVGRPLPLAVAYVYRPMLVGRRLPAALGAWHRARRRG